MSESKPKPKFKWWWVFSAKKMQAHAEELNDSERSKFVDHLMLFSVAGPGVAAGFAFDNAWTAAIVGQPLMVVLFGVMLLFFLYTLVSNMRAGLERMSLIHDYVKQCEQQFDRIVKTVKEVEEAENARKS